MFANEGSGDLHWGPNGTNSKELGAFHYIPEKAWNETNATSTRRSCIHRRRSQYLLLQTRMAVQGPGVPDDNARDLPDVSLTRRDP